MSFDLLPSYYKLLKEYDQILILTDKLLYSIRSGVAEDVISSLQDERLKTMHRIQKLTKSLSHYEPADSERKDLQMVQQLRAIHKKLEEKADLLRNKERELEKLVDFSS